MKQPRYLRDWQLRCAMGLAMVVPVLIAALLAKYALQHQPQPEPKVVSLEPVALSSLEIASAHELERLFAQRDYHWPPAAEVPALALKQLPDGLDELQGERKKQLFFRIILPLALAENQRLAVEREWLLAIERGDTAAEPERLAALARRYRVEPQQPLERQLAELLRRVDGVPVGLVLAQAANESGWGTSRFSREVNNLFGEWTWDAEQGILPASRPEGATHYVRRFENLQESVRAYIHNLNSGRAYSKLRHLRAQMRKADEQLDPQRLAEGLLYYSSRGEEYIRDIQLMIQGNGLNRLGPMDLRR